MQQIIDSQVIQITKPLTQFTTGAPLTAKFIDDLIMDIQETDLTEYLGMRFTDILCQDLSNSDYQDLLNGSTFQDSTGQDLTHKGIRNFMVELFWFRYLRNPNNLFSTRAGLRKPTRGQHEGSAPTNDDLEELYSRQEKRVNAVWMRIRRYLDLVDVPQYRKTFVRSRVTVVKGRRSSFRRSLCNCKYYPCDC